MRVADRLPRTKGQELGSAVDRLFAGLEGAPCLLLAVSGGPDSMALMHLAAHWTQRRADAPPLHVATVDHDLRTDSHADADLVASTAEALKLSHETLAWAGAKPKTRVQERARVARYALLTDRAREIGATHILTAHHADDQAETVLLRLGHGSGIGGLAGMRRLSAPAPGFWLCRPLLDLTKAELVTFCRDHSVAFVEDPSNRDVAFARTKLRTLAPVLAEIGLDSPGLSRFAYRMARADMALEAETDRVERLLQPARQEGGYEVDLHAGRTIAPEIALRLVRRAVVYVGGGPSLRLERLEALSEVIWRALAVGHSLRGTLAGTLVRLDRAGRLRITREAERRRGRAAPRDRPPPVKADSTHHPAATWQG